MGGLIRGGPVIADAFGAIVVVAVAARVPSGLSASVLPLFWYIERAYQSLNVRPRITPMTFLASTGRVAVERLRGLNHLAAVLVAVVIAILSPRRWPRTIRDAISRQIVSAGVEAVGFVSLIAFLAGVLIVVQVQLWLTKVAQSRLLGPVLVTVVIRELGPLLANFVVIARSGNAMAAELGNMKTLGEVRSLEAQGIDPFEYLVMPRVLGAMVSTFCLTIVFILVSLGSGYVCARLAGVRVGAPLDFAESVTRAIGGADLINVVTKAVVPALIWGAICCIEGLSVVAPVDVPRAASRSLQRSLVALFVILAAVSVLTYT